MGKCRYPAKDRRVGKFSLSEFLRASVYASDGKSPISAGQSDISSVCISRRFQYWWDGNLVLANSYANGCNDKISRRTV